MKKKIYVAGAYTNGDTAINVRKAIELGNIILGLGYSPYIPHLTHFWHMVYPREARVWYEHDLEWLRVCDAMVIMVPEVPSFGLSQEEHVAMEINMPIFCIGSETWSKNEIDWKIVEKGLWNIFHPIAR